MAKRGPKPKRKETRGRPRKHPVGKPLSKKVGRKTVTFLDDPDRFVICIARILEWVGNAPTNKALTIAIMATQGGESENGVVESDAGKCTKFFLAPSPVYGPILPNSDTSLNGRIRYLKG